jgi:adenine-specific DNA-methyltransferase
MAKKSAPKPGKKVEALRHKEDKRRNIPTAEHQSVIEKTEEAPKEVRYPRNTDLDPQLMWRGKDYQDWSDLVVQAPPLYIQEKIQPKVLIDDLMRQSRTAAAQESGSQIDLFADFNGIPEGAEKTEFYKHDQNWSNRMILGDSLQVMASLAEREGLRGKVQCIYFDPPYGIKFNSNFQWSTTSRDVKDGNAAHITREPEQVKAFRDTWKDGIHSYLTYLRDRLTVARDLLSPSGSIFVQIGEENAHRLRVLMEEVFGEENFAAVITFAKNSGATDDLLASPNDHLMWFCRDKKQVKYRRLFWNKAAGAGYGERYGKIREADGRRRSITAAELDDPSVIPTGAQPYTETPPFSAGFRATTSVPFVFRAVEYDIGTQRNWKTHLTGMERLGKADRLIALPKLIYYERRLSDFPVATMTTVWPDTQDRLSKTYVVETVPKVVQRCVLMTTDPGDLVLDPTCGSGTAAHVAEQWGRRWIVIDTSRVALALARARIVGAKYSFYTLTDSPEGIKKEAEASGRACSDRATFGNVRQGFVYDRVPHITLKSIANNSEIDVIWEKWQQKVTDALLALNATRGPDSNLLEWQVPRDAPAGWSDNSKSALAAFWKTWATRQHDIDASIVAKADVEYLYDRPFEDKKKVRVAGPFTVESLSPHRMLNVSADDELIDPLAKRERNVPDGMTFEEMILENLKAAGVQQAHKQDRITFTSLIPWPGELVCGEGRYREGDTEKRAGIFIGPEFGTVGRADLVKAAREAGDAGFDVLIACAFNYEAHAAEFSKLGRIPVLKARMNADLHMAGDLKATDKANLFVIFGEPDIEIHHQSDSQIFVQVKGVDVFDPSTGEVRSDSADGIACWFIDTDYNEESFFVRHAYFLGQNDPYSALRTTLKAEINADAWATLHSDTSRPFPKPTSGRIAVKVINHLGDEVMKVFRVE